MSAHGALNKFMMINCSKGLLKRLVFVLLIKTFNVLWDEGIIRGYKKNGNRFIIFVFLFILYSSQLAKIIWYSRLCLLLYLRVKRAMLMTSGSLYCVAARRGFSSV